MFPNNVNITKIEGGGHHSLFLSSTNNVWSCGYASHGQLGLRNTENKCKPCLVKDLKNKIVTQISAGWNHSLILTSKFDLYATGFGTFGQLGLESDEFKTRFTWVESVHHKNIWKISAGGNHSWVILDHEIQQRFDNETPSPL